jgi:hypothetical protein
LKKKIAINWEKLSNDELLQVRIKDLGLQISGSWLETAIELLHQGTHHWNSILPGTSAIDIDRNRNDVRSRGGQSSRLYETASS